MDLFLWRHADAGEAFADDPKMELARPLSPRGEKQAKRMAEWLDQFLPDSTRILVSPALRCRQTAQALSRRVRVMEGLAPGASHSAALALARWPERREPVLLVGHQPMLGQLAAYLVGGPATLATPAWSVRKGAVWWLHHRERGGVAEVALMSIRSPEKL